MDGGLAYSRIASGPFLDAVPVGVTGDDGSFVGMTGLVGHTAPVLFVVPKCSDSGRSHIQFVHPRQDSGWCRGCEPGPDCGLNEFAGAVGAFEVFTDMTFGDLDHVVGTEMVQDQVQGGSPESGAGGGVPGFEYCHGR